MSVSPFSPNYSPYPSSSAPSAYSPPPAPSPPRSPDGQAPLRRPTVQVVRSSRRRKTVSARLVGDLLRVSIPASMSAAEEAHWVARMAERMERRRRSDEVDLAGRAARLAARFGLRTPAEIRWVDNQQTRWGSCTPGPGTVRINSQLAREPVWVLDYVIVHELAHLEVAAHNRAFWRLVARYPLAERARGFLMARGLEDPGPAAGEEPLFVL